MPDNSKKVANFSRICAIAVFIFCGNLLLGLNPSPVEAVEKNGFAPNLSSTLNQTVPVPPGGNKHLLEQEIFYQQRAYPNTVIPAGAYQKALEQSQKLPQATPPRFVQSPASSAPGAPGVPTQATPWTFIGPGATTSSTFPSGIKYSGRTNSIVIDPNNTNIIYVATAGGGVWKTTNAGASWAPLTDTQPTLAFGSLALDPVNSSTVYAGSGEENFAGDSYYGRGILKSSNGGSTWTLNSGTSFGNPGSPIYLDPAISKLIVDPNNTSHIIAATSRGVYTSTDGGVNFNLALNKPYVTDMVADSSTSPTTVYAGVGYPFGYTSNGIYKSTDGGLTFSSTLVGTGYPQGSTAGRVALDISPQDHSLYAVFSNPSNYNLMGLYKSTDGGTTWATISTTPAAGDSNFFCSTYGCQGWYDMYVRVDPTSTSTIYIGGVDIYKTSNSGANWTNLTRVYSSSTSSGVHPDQHNLTFAPGNSTTIYAVNDGGVFKSTDGGTTWTSLNTNLGTLQFYGGSAGPNFASTPVVYGGTQDNGDLQYQPPSLDWRNQRECGDGFYAAVDPVTPTTAYVDCQTGYMQKTTDGGTTFSDAVSGLPQGGFTTFFRMDPNNSSRLLWAGLTNIYETTNGAASWHLFNNTSGFGGGGNYTNIRAIDIQKGNSSVVYVGGNRNVVHGTINNGTTWTSSTNLPNRMITSIAADPRLSTNALVTVSGFGTGHVFKTVDTGATFVDVSGNLPDVPVNSVLIDPFSATTWYVGTDTGFFFTTNSGLNWNAVPTNLPNSPIYQIFADPGFNTIFAATHGRGIFALSNPTTCTIAIDPTNLVVNSVNDNIPTDSCTITLRKALTLAANATSPSTITFGLPSGSIIYVTSALPPVTSNVTVSASNLLTTSNGRAVPHIRVDGTNAGAVNGFTINGSKITVESLQITGFKGYGIVLTSGASTVSIYSNYIGTADGITSAANYGGIRINELASNNKIGGTTISSPLLRGNLISGNSGLNNSYAIYSLSSSSFNNQIQNNLIGYNAAGTGILSNGGSGVFSYGGLVFISGNRIKR